MQIALPPALHAQVGHAAKTTKGPRALGLLELDPDGKARLIPIAILIDGKYYDASAYKAAPVPMALWTDTVYEAIHTGVSLGLFTVTAPQQHKDEGGQTVWWAEGGWQTAESLKAMAAKKKPVASTPRGMNDDEGPPVLRRAGAAKPKPPETPPAPSTPRPTQPAPSASPGPAATPASAPATTSASSSPPAPPQSQDDRPPVDNDRPTLKRGQAGATSAAEAQEKASPTNAVTPTVPATSKPATTAAQPVRQIQLIPAISDPHPSDSLPYSYKMSAQEEQAFRKKMLAMAADEIRARAAQLAPATAATKSVHAPAPRSKAAPAKPVQPTFEDVQLQVFDLADINEPELVLTAKAQMPQSSHDSKPDLQYMITLVVREDVNGDLHKSLANVTDTQHLDVIPRLDLIDAVDVDGDGRAELLFREVSDTSSAFVVYRVIGDQLYPMFQGSL